MTGIAPRDRFVVLAPGNEVLQHLPGVLLIAPSALPPSSTNWTFEARCSTLTIS
jgi:hypothetical protein